MSWCVLRKTNWSQLLILRMSSGRLVPAGPPVTDSRTSFCSIYRFDSPNSPCSSPSSSLFALPLQHPPSLPPPPSRVPAGAPPRRPHGGDRDPRRLLCRPLSLHRTRQEGPPPAQTSTSILSNLFPTKPTPTVAKKTPTPTKAKITTSAKATPKSTKASTKTAASTTQLSATGAAWAWYQGEGVDARTRQQRQATVVGALVLLGALAPTVAGLRGGRPGKRGGGNPITWSSAQLVMPRLSMPSLGIPSSVSGGAKSEYGLVMPGNKRVDPVVPTTTAAENKASAQAWIQNWRTSGAGGRSTGGVGESQAVLGGMVATLVMIAAALGNL